MVVVKEADVAVEAVAAADVAVAAPAVPVVAAGKAQAAVLVV